MSSKMNHSEFRWTYLSSLSDGPLRTRAQNFIERVNWQALLEYATRKRHGVKGILLPPIGLGGNHLVRIIEFTDDIRWVARLQLPSLDGQSYPIGSRERMKAEVCMAAVVLQNTTVPVPRVHAYETSHETTIGAPFMLLNCLEGNVGMDLSLEVPPEYKKSFFKRLAEIHVAIATVRLPQIGTILSINHDGTFNQGPIEGVGGPFSTATEFFRAWGKSAKFPMPEERLRATSGRYADEIVTAVSNFPKAFSELADRLSQYEHGPFPLFHGDFGHNNIIVDHDYQVLGVIDWEAAYAAPWEVAGSWPLSIRTAPPAIDLPSKYDEYGNPKDPGLAERFADQQRYIEAIKEEEEKLGAKGHASISNVLEDTRRRQIITAMMLYRNGKAGFYSRAIEQFTSA